MWASVRRLAALAAAGGMLGCPALAPAQEIHPGEQQGLGLRGPAIPELLKTVAADPYKAPADPACQTIPAELLALDKVLGADADDPAPKKSYMAAFAAREAGGAVRGLIPYRGAIRFLTGADHKDHELIDAARAGWARRGFLRGLEASLSCAPVKLAVVATASDATLEPTVTATGSPDAAKTPAAFEPAQMNPAAIILAEPGREGADRPGR